MQLFLPKAFLLMIIGLLVFGLTGCVSSKDAATDSSSETRSTIITEDALEASQVND